MKRIFNSSSIHILNKFLTTSFLKLVLLTIKGIEYKTVNANFSKKRNKNSLSVLNSRKPNHNSLYHLKL